MFDSLEMIDPLKKLYTLIIEETCNKFHLTRMEVDILLFLANHPNHDSAKDIIQMRYLTKSHVSTALKSLEDRCLIERYYQDSNKKTVHIRLLESTNDIIEHGRLQQLKFKEILTQDLTTNDLQQLEKLFSMINQNIMNYLEELK